MSSITRRSVALCGFAFFVPKLVFSGARSLSSVEKAKRDFLRPLSTALDPNSKPPRSRRAGKRAAPIW